MSKRYIPIVRSGKSWLSPETMKIVHIGKDYSDCLKYIKKNIKPGDHMYIDKVKER